LASRRHAALHIALLRQWRRGPRQRRLLLLRRRVWTRLALLLWLPVPGLTILVRRRRLLLGVISAGRRSLGIRRLLSIRILLIHRVLRLRRHTMLLGWSLWLGRRLAICAGGSRRRRATIHPSLWTSRRRRTVPRLAVVLLRHLGLRAHLRLGWDLLLRGHLLLWGHLLLRGHLLWGHLLRGRLLGRRTLSIRLCLCLRLPCVRLRHRILRNLPTRIQRDSKWRGARRAWRASLLLSDGREHSRALPYRLVLLGRNLCIWR
jgi:hypothetical protein